MLNRTVARVLYYTQNTVRDAVPRRYFIAKRLGVLNAIEKADLAEISSRLEYYNKLSAPFSASSGSHAIEETRRDRSRYYFDFMEAARYFDGDLQVRTMFGDITHVPDLPTIVKSRPIGDTNQNSVLMKLDKFRHFQGVNDPRPFTEKQSKIVWRGSPNNTLRHTLLEKFYDHPSFDVGSTGGSTPSNWQKPFLSISDQLRYRYIVSIEGNDVATNLKWIMSSNSLCFSPRPKYETWFMEGRLEAGRHYVVIRDDMADIEEKFHYFETHPEEAKKIIDEAQTYFKSFLNEKIELALSILVLEKYLSLSGQLQAHSIFK